MSAEQNKKKSPFELWTGEKSNVNYIRIFECLAYVHIFKNKRNKLNSVFYKRIFTSYHSSIQWKIFNSKTKKIVWHSFVIFRKNNSDKKLFKNSEKNEEIIIGIFDDDTENDEIDRND